MPPVVIEHRPLLQPLTAVGLLFFLLPVVWHVLKAWVINLKYRRFSDLLFASFPVPHFLFSNAPSLVIHSRRLL